MSVVLLFEAQVQPGRLEAYVHYALEAQRDLAAADGCLSTEQLMAVDEARRIMVKSIWRDSASAQAWNRTNGALLADGQLGSLSLRIIPYRSFVLPNSRRRLRRRPRFARLQL